MMNATARKAYSHRGKEDGATPFGDRLKKERLRRGFGLTEFAERVGCAVSQVTGAENRGVIPRLPIVIAMAQVLDCSIDYLAGLEQ
jgi:transcriptional regulator with XRE-family HTH domain